MGKTAFQAGAHGTTGGIMSAIEGGNFVSGFAAGAISSIISSGVQGIAKNLSTTLRDAITIASGGLSGGISSSIAGGNFWRGVKQGLITSGLNHVAHAGANALKKKSVIDLDQRKEQDYNDEYFNNKKEAYDYAMEESMLIEDKSGNGYHLTREVSGFGLENGDYIVLDPRDNTSQVSWNRYFLKEGNLYARYSGVLYKIKSHFHSHPNYPAVMYHHPGGGTRPSTKDLTIFYEVFSPKGIQMSILFKGEEWLISRGNQFSRGGYNYSFTNLGAW